MTQIEMILDKISTLEGRIKRLEGRSDDMLVFNNSKVGSGFEELTGLDLNERQTAYAMVGEAKDAIGNFLLSSQEQDRLARFIATKEVEWNLSAAEGDEYNFWMKVHEEIQG
jgi:hypothetical protein